MVVAGGRSGLGTAGMDFSLLVIYSMQYIAIYIYIYMN